MTSWPFDYTASLAIQKPELRLIMFTDKIWLDKANMLHDKLEWHNHSVASLNHFGKLRRSWNSYMLRKIQTETHQTPKLCLYLCLHLRVHCSSIKSNHFLKAMAIIIRNNVKKMTSAMARRFGIYWLFFNIRTFRPNVINGCDCDRRKWRMFSISISH